MRDATPSRRGRRYLALLALALSVAAVIALPRAPRSYSTASLLALFVAVLLLDFFDLSLPHGDRIGLEGPLVAASLLVLPALPVLAIGLAARGLAQLLTRRGGGLDESIFDLSTTAVGLGAASSTSYVVLAFSGSWPGANYLAVGLSCAALLVAQLVYMQALSAIRMRRPFRGLLLGNLRFQGPLLLAEISTSVLLVMTYERMGIWALALAVILLLLLRHSYALLIDVRQAYMSTVEVLVETAESADPRRSGHSERTASLARDIAEELGLASTQIERLSYAALLHDLDMVGLDPGVTIGPGDVRQTGRVLQAVSFLRDVVPVLRILDGDAGALERATSEQRMLALVVAVASDVDSREHGVPLVGQGDVIRIAGMVAPEDKSRVVGATLRLGHSVPAVP